MHVFIFFPQDPSRVLLFLILLIDKIKIFYAKIATASRKRNWLWVLAPLRAGL